MTPADVVADRTARAEQAAAEEREVLQLIKEVKWIADEQEAELRAVTAD
jgi:hypothetical protein